MLFNKQVFDRIHEQLDCSVDGDVGPLKCDRWIASSLLQKSIRRGDSELAYRAAFRVQELDRSGIWRRLIIIAFEDVGAGDIGALIDTVFESLPPNAVGHAATHRSSNSSCAG